MGQKLSDMLESMFKWFLFFAAAFIFFVWCKIGFPDFIVKIFWFCAAEFIMIGVVYAVVNKIKKNQ